MPASVSLFLFPLALIMWCRAASVPRDGMDGWCDSYLVILLHEPAGWSREVLQGGRADGMGWAGSVVWTCWKLHHLAPRTLAHNYIICRAIPRRNCEWSMQCVCACNKYMRSKCFFFFFFFKCWDQTGPSCGCRVAAAALFLFQQSITLQWGHCWWFYFEMH